jgi:hypothetical protein
MAKLKTNGSWPRTDSRVYVTARCARLGHTDEVRGGGAAKGRNGLNACTGGFIDEG